MNYSVSCNLRVIYDKFRQKIIEFSCGSNLKISKNLNSTSEFHKKYKNLLRIKKNDSVIRNFEIAGHKYCKNKIYKSCANQNFFYHKNAFNSSDFNFSTPFFVPYFVIIPKTPWNLFMTMTSSDIALVSRISNRKFIDLTPRLINASVAKEVTPVVTKRTSTSPALIIYKPTNYFPRSNCWWKKLNFVSIINFDYPCGNSGQLFCDLANQESEKTTELKLICFEDKNDAMELINAFPYDYKQEIQRVNPIVLKPNEAELMAIAMGLDIFVLRKGELEVDADWTIDDFTNLIFRVSEIRKCAQNISCRPNN